MEWNINGRGGNRGVEFPNFIMDTISPQGDNNSPDIIVLIEFYKRNGWENFYDNLSRQYIVCLSEDRGVGKNQILIAIRKNLHPVIKSVCSHIPTGQRLLKNSGLEHLHPEFLQVDVIIEKDNERKPLAIVGTRIKTQDENRHFINREKQFELLMNHVDMQNDPILVVGDFNHGVIKNENDKNYIYTGVERQYYSYQNIWREAQSRNCQVTTPVAQYDKAYSVVVSLKGVPYRIKEDHFIVRGIGTLHCSYDWSFVDSNATYYKEKKCAEYLGAPAGLPDHACLRGVFEF